MSDQNNNNSSRPGNTPRPSDSGSRIGRIGQWGASGGSAPSNSRSSSDGRFATLGDLNSSGRGGGHAGHGHAGPGPAGNDDDSDDEQEGQTFFAGGERSGLSVQNPNRRDRPEGEMGNILQNLLRKAHEAGGAQSTSAGPAPRGAFSGAGHTLGSEEVESRVVPDPSAVPGSAAEERVTRHIHFWRNGFSVEDGPLMSYTDPANADILRALDAGQAPAEILNVRYGQSVELLIDRRMEEEYVAPKAHPRQVFEGAGHRLGAPTPPIAGTSSSAATGSTSPPVSRADEVESLQTKFEVDQSQPTTSIQLRLVDGTRMLCRMNLTHTIRDIRNFINASRPENLTRPYTISTTFPNRILDDDMQTIEAAKLMNSVVVQRWA